jgi:Flp pilus assembly pilin Flp
VTGLYHLRNREYDPGSGRFLQEDPIWFNAGDLNVYRYTWNNPLKYTDPSGTTAAIEYACLADFAVGAGTTAGTTLAGGIAGVFANVAGALGSQQAPAIADHVYNAMAVFAAHVAQGGGRCRVTGPPVKPRSCPCKCGGKNSFGAGTLVLTKEGLKPIEDVRVGELVAAWDSETGKARWQPVKARSMREAPQVMRLTVRDEAGRVETVVVTPNHPYLRPDGSYDLLKAVSMEPGGDWSAAGSLSPGDRVASVSGRTLEVVASEVDLSPARVYNLEVAGDHTYAVGELQAWVHNARGFPGHTQNRHMPKIPGKSTFKKPSGVNKLVRRTLKRPDCITEQDNGNVRYDKDFGRQTGTDKYGNPISGVTVIVGPGGKIITSFPR